MLSTEKSFPSARALVLSMRAMGYELETAISDLIDNSIFAKARNILIEYSWNNADPWIMISDDGEGMNEKMLKEAMKPGSQSPDDLREEGDLGRFGLGLKTASWSQCKKMTVMSKMNGDKCYHRQWDLDYVVEKDDWELIKTLDNFTNKQLSECLSNKESGTAVLWQNLDRIVGELEDVDENVEELETEFLEKFSETVQPHLEMTFHRFLSGRDKISIKVGRSICKPWDPFLSSNEFSEERSTEYFDSGIIIVTPFILPHTSHLSEDEKLSAQGPGGWSKQQGFYVYRNKRMIISGGYLGLNGRDGKEFPVKDHFGLGRIKVDLPNHIDHEWRIDVRKAAASPPLRLRRDFERIAKSTRDKSAEVYRRRTVTRTIPGKKTHKMDIWNKRKVGGKSLYKVNRNSPAIEHIRSNIGVSKRKLNALLHLIERTVPYRGITVDNNDLIDSTVDLPEEAVEPPLELIEMAKDFVREEISRGKASEVAVDYVCKVAFGLQSAQFRFALEKEFM